MTRAYAIWLWDYPIPMPRMQRGLRDGLINEEQYNAIVEANQGRHTAALEYSFRQAIEIHGDQEEEPPAVSRLAK